MTNWTQSNHDPDWPIRAQALLTVERLAISTGDRIPWSEITKGFSHKGQQIQLASRALGIFKPRQMSAALSIKTIQPRAGRPMPSHGIDPAMECPTSSRHAEQ